MENSKRASSEKPSVLVIDDDQMLRDFLRYALLEAGVEVAEAQDGQEGMARYAERRFDVVFVDLHMPGMDGIEVLKRLRTQDPNASVIVLTGQGSIESAVQAMKAGAVDYLTKPLHPDHLEVVLNKTLEGRRQARQLRLLEEQLIRHGSFEGLVGVSAEMQRVYEYVRKIAPSGVTVLIQGETGTGKERVAQAIHNLSDRREKRFVPVNCGALTETLLESELFGHEKGAFTGAVRRKVGLIEQADGGTLFLDEIEAMSPALQVRLLRAIQEREVHPVGGEQPVRVDFRLVAASNENLQGLMEKGAFRTDLFYRLNVANLELPPLRARREDIPLLANHFLSVYARKEKRYVEEIAPDAMMALKAHAWPGNVRELENVIQHAVLLCEGGKIVLKELPRGMVPSGSEPGVGGPQKYTLFQAQELFERRYIEDVLAQANGQVTEAARIAGVYRSHFYKKMKHHGISAGRKETQG
jgi:DNA-binding NtrC family response regulator